MTDRINDRRHCTADDFGAYLDGELAAERRREVELHLADCHECNDELNFQKRLLLALEAPLADVEIELPKDFTKRVVAHAETRVDGLRQPNERLNALFICVALLLFSLFALGAEVEATFATVGLVFDVIGAVGGTAIHFVLDMGLAAAVIVKTLFLTIFSGASGPGVAAVVVFLVVATFLSRYLLRQDRA